jgi:hypothetical protein
MQSAKTFASAGSGMVQRPPLQVFTCAFPSLRTQVAAFLLIAPLQVDVPALSMARLAPRAVRAVANATQSSHCRAVASQTPFGSRPWLHGQQQQQGGCSGLAPAAVGMQGSTWPAGWRTLALGSVASGASASAAPFPALVAPRGGQGASDIQQPTAPLAARPAAAAGWLQRQQQRVSELSTSVYAAHQLQIGLCRSLCLRCGAPWRRAAHVLNRPGRQCVEHRCTCRHVLELQKAGEAKPQPPISPACEAPPGPAPWGTLVEEPCFPGVVDRAHCTCHAAQPQGCRTTFRKEPPPRAAGAPVSCLTARTCSLVTGPGREPSEPAPSTRARCRTRWRFTELLRLIAPNGSQLRSLRRLQACSARRGDASTPRSVSRRGLWCGFRLLLIL